MRFLTMLGRAAFATAAKYAKRRRTMFSQQSLRKPSKLPDFGNENAKDKNMRYKKKNCCSLGLHSYCKAQFLNNI